MALVGPGRAGTAVATALVTAGWQVVTVAGRAPDAPSTQAAAARFGAEATALRDAARDVDLVVIATPDAAIEAVAAELATAVRSDALVVHLSGARGVDVLGAVPARTGALHPLQTLPSAEVGAARLPGAWCAVAGDPQVVVLARSIGLQPIEVADGDRTAYHAAACIAANHLVALLAQVERVAPVPLEAFLPLVRAAVENVAQLGPQAALTGPVARGDVETVRSHLGALPDGDREAYLALGAARLRALGPARPRARRSTAVIVVDTVADLRARCEEARRAGRTVGLVPTMGYFHAGHRSLMAAARAAADLVVVSLFVNPTQFGPNEDLSAYPRDLDRDRVDAETEGVDLLFVPPLEAIYPDGPTLTTVHVDRLTAGLCGASRPVHFDGVTTVVTKLFSIVGPCTAFFGRKDYQQLAVIRQMVTDLNMPVDVRGCPLVREPDGVAMSSRNAYLTDEERTAARVLSQSLEGAAIAANDGERDSRALETRVRAIVGDQPLVALEYAEVRDARTLEPVATIAGEVVLAVAAKVGRARLIDNVVLTVRGDEVDADLGTRTGEPDL